MIEERAMAGAKALSGWLSSCRVMVGEVKGATFRKLRRLWWKLYSCMVQRSGEVAEF